MASVGKGAPQKLNTVKRDTRTIEEIERDMRAKKSAASSSSSGLAGSKGKEVAGARSNGSGSAATGGARPRNGASASSKPAARRRSASPSSDSASSSEDDARRRERKRRRKASAEQSSLNHKQRETIWQIMGVKRKHYDDSDSEGSSDMEATGRDVLEEERQACVPLSLFPLSSRSRFEDDADAALSCAQGPTRGEGGRRGAGAAAARRRAEEGAQGRPRLSRSACMTNW